ncbi:hypothetical protein PG994_014205 [Apiospora phragmitis]|uniref:Uncharacterized protein n=1 Tax=Apiospora phragmitis TaxID=2905665 RepID=A0ABR1T3N9_9PEZI
MAAASSSPEVNFITGNANKLREVKAILEPAGIVVRSQAVELPELQGEIEDVTLEKCRVAARQVGGPVLVETPVSASMRWGVCRAFTSSATKGSTTCSRRTRDKSAEAVCTFAFSKGPDHEPLLFQGRTPGKIVPARGPGHFGWDPIFEYEGETYAEMDPAAKNKISHRFRALDKVRTWVEEGMKEDKQ